MRRHPVTGKIAHGIAGDGVYVRSASGADTQIKSGNGESGMPDWWGDRLIYIGQDVLRSCLPDGTDDTLITLNGSPVPSSLVLASPFGWVSWTPNAGVTFSSGARLPKAFLLDVCKGDGTVLVGDNYQPESPAHQSGPGLSAYTAIGARVWQVPDARPRTFLPYAQAAILDAGRACWTEDLNSLRVLKGFGLPAPPRPSWGVLTPTLQLVDDAVWVTYLRPGPTNPDDALLAHRWDDPSRGAFVAGVTFSPNGFADAAAPQGLTIAWSLSSGERLNEIRTLPVQALEVIPPVPTPPVEEPIGPRSQPLPEGTEIDLGAFFIVDDRSWPRGNKPKGDTHGMDMQSVLHKGRPCIWFAKFDDDGWVTYPPAPNVKGALGELLTVDDDPEGYIHLLADCSDSGNPSTQRRAEVGTETDTRWLKKRMRIGRQYGLTTPQHQLIKWDRATGQEIRREDFNREMWIESVWPKFYCGLEWGECEVVRYVMNNTGYQPGGTGNPDLWVETYYVARKKLPDGSWQCIVWGDWTSDASNVVFAGGGVTFPNPPTVHSDFWHLGGKRYPPAFPSFIPGPQVPEEPTVPEPNIDHLLPTRQSFVAVNPLPQGGDDVAVHAWSRAVAEYLKFVHGTVDGMEIGLKSRSSGSPVSNNLTLRAKEAGFIHTWDYIEGSAGPTPRLYPNWGEYFYAEQFFIPVQAIDHLASAGPTPGRAKVSGTIWAVDAFDLNARCIGLNDFRWLDQVIVPNQLHSRQFLYATPIGAPRLDRDFATGLRQMRTLFQHMRTRKARSSLITVLNGTRKNGLSWQGALDQCRAVNALALEYPELIALFALFNENLQGFEQDYATNPQFLKEAEACFDLRFPVSPGSAWGDQPPLRVCGSVLTPHADRALVPDAAAARMVVPGWDVIDEEGMGITEVGRTAGRQRVSDPQWAAQQIAAVKKYGLKGSVLHIDAGMTCDVRELGPVQNMCIAMYGAEAKGTVIPVPGGHPVLDCYLPADRDPVTNKVSAYTNEGYVLMVDNSDLVEAEIVAWHRRAYGIAPSIGTIQMVKTVRSGIECGRWETLRGALMNLMPGGAPPA